MIRTAILGTFFLASEAERKEGEGWYQLANDQVIKMSAKYGLPHSTCAGVIAALSPNNVWQRNLTDAHNIIRSYVLHGAGDARQVKVCTFNGNKEKAIDILNGNDPLEVLGGLKVRSFYSLILHPLDPENVCIDGHAYSIWKGERVSTSSTPKITPRLYAEIQQSYRDAAQRISTVTGEDWLPSQIQAVTWVTHRNLYRGVRG